LSNYRRISVVTRTTVATIRRCNIIEKNPATSNLSAAASQK
jgi:hypothetical protein